MDQSDRLISFIPCKTHGVLAAACLVVGTVAGTASAAFNQQAIGIAGGFNADTIVDAAASTTTGTHTANGTVGANPDPSAGNINTLIYTSSNNVVTSTISAANSGYGPTGAVHNQNVFFENGWNGKTDGLPAGGAITSEYTNVTGGNTQFQLGYNGTANDLANNNTVYFTSGTTGGAASPLSQTVTLAGQFQAQSLDFLSTGSVPNPGATPFVNSVDVTLNFADGTHSTYSQGISNGGDGYGPGPFAPNIAYGQVTTNNVFKGTADGNSNHTDNGASNGHLYESDIALTAADQNETITSITFTPNSMTGPTEEIYAISGVVSAVVPEPASIGLLAVLGGFGVARRRRAR